jgi:hypothetical protein
VDLDLVQLLQAMAENPWVCIQHLDLASNSLTGTADAFLSELHWHLPLRQACVRVLAFASAHVCRRCRACCPSFTWVVPRPRPCKLQAVWRWANSSRVILFTCGCGAAGELARDHRPPVLPLVGLDLSNNAVDVGALATVLTAVRCSPPPLTHCFFLLFFISIGLIP